MSHTWIRKFEVFLEQIAMYFSAGVTSLGQNISPSGGFYQCLFGKYLTALPMALLLWEVKQTQTDGVTSRHVHWNTPPTWKTLEHSGNSSCPWGHWRVWESWMSPSSCTRQTLRRVICRCVWQIQLFLTGTGNHSNLNGPVVSVTTFPSAHFASDMAKCEGRWPQSLEMSIAMCCRDGERWPSQ